MTDIKRKAGSSKNRQNLQSSRSLAEMYATYEQYLDHLVNLLDKVDEFVSAVHVDRINISPMVSVTTPIKWPHNVLARTLNCTTLNQMPSLSASELSSEVLRAGEYIEYYTPLHVQGDRRGHRISRVLRIDGDAEFLLSLDTDEILPVTWFVKRYADADATQYLVNVTKWRKIRTLTHLSGSVASNEELSPREAFVAILRNIRDSVSIGTEAVANLPAEGSIENPIVPDED
ncbi:hypothetical protein PC119_g10909 [Phytophthora cactorum]|nr:hypothetical protein PC119_g10909 [Phytophthora cactorum]KAG3084304.1 hypothetical protein PC122_g10208 [Phytophthora cactorum]KAG3167308.1 hypothetical protein C6341_g11760 [Phytophthora cactorum]